MVVNSRAFKYKSFYSFWSDIQLYMSAFFPNSDTAASLGKAQL